MMHAIVIICCASVCIGRAERLYVKDACVWESFEVSCSSNREVLLIKKALYGRMRSTRCFNLSTGEMPCYADVQSFVERHCGGSKSCRLIIKNENLKLSPSNCTLYSQKYLEIEYSCQVVYKSEDQTCVSNQSLLVTTSSGFLANIVTDETGQGSQMCPWRFSPRSGQTVHLTLLDFGVWIDRADRDRRDMCRIYATVKEFETTHRNSERVTLVCGGREREKLIISTESELSIAMMKQERTVNDTTYFLLKYQVFECPHFEGPVLAITERSEIGIRITCQFNSELVWDIKCISGSWTPRYIINCPEMTTIASNSTGPTTMNTSILTKSFVHTSVVVLSIVAGAVAITVFVCIFVCFGRKFRAGPSSGLGQTEQSANPNDMISYDFTNRYDEVERVYGNDNILTTNFPPRLGPLPSPGNAGLTPDEPSDVYSRINHIDNDELLSPYPLEEELVERFYMNFDSDFGSKHATLANYFSKGSSGHVFGPIPWYGMQVAVKQVMFAYGKVTDEFKKDLEAKRDIWALLEHKNLTRIHRVDLSQLPKVMFIVMDFAAGGALHRTLTSLGSGNKLPIKVLDDWTKQIAEGMLYLHQRNIIHRDLKSSNILLMEPFDIRNTHTITTLKITDFDDVKEYDQTATMSFVGTVAYMAPEVIGTQRFSKASDVWSFGVVVWEMLSGDIPHKGLEQGAIMSKFHNGTLDDLPIGQSFPEGYKLILIRCWKPTCGDRLSFDKIFCALQRMAKGEDVTEVLKFNGNMLQECSQETSNVIHWK